MCTLSKHAIVRSKQRIGAKTQKKAQRIAQNALDRGLGVDNTKGALKRFIGGIEDKKGNTKVKIYQDRIFVFGDNEVLITVLLLPKRMKSLVLNATKKA